MNESRDLWDRGGDHTESRSVGLSVCRSVGLSVCRGGLSTSVGKGRSVVTGRWTSPKSSIVGNHQWQLPRFWQSTPRQSAAVAALPIHFIAFVLFQTQNSIEKKKTQKKSLRLWHFNRIVGHLIALVSQYSTLSSLFMHHLSLYYRYYHQYINYQFIIYYIIDYSLFCSLFMYYLWLYYRYYYQYIN